MKTDNKLETTNNKVYIPDNKIEIFDCEQGSEEWFQVRKGLCTSSEAKQLFSADKGFKTYLESKEAEQYLEYVEKDFGGNYWTNRGNTLEPIARELFEQATFLKVREIGFIRNLFFNAGTSTDGIIEKINWGLEIKCFDYKRHYQVIKNGGPDSDAYNQMQFSLAVSNLKGYYSVNYNPNFVEKHRLIIHKVERNETTIKATKYLLMHVKNELKKLKI